MRRVREVLYTVISGGAGGKGGAFALGAGTCAVSSSSYSFNSVPGLLFCILALVGLSACDLAANYQKPDRGSNMEIQDFRDGLSERLPAVDDASGSGAAFSSSGNSSLSSVPSLQPYVSTKSSSAAPMPLVSVSVNQSVPLRDILFELADQANYDLELDPNIRGSIIFTARNKPFDQVIARIADVAGLRYKFEDGHVRVELDTPYGKVYKLDYLSYLRENKSSVSTDVSVVSGEETSAGSSYASKSSSLADFWGELEQNLTQILGSNSAGNLRTARDPRISAVDQTPDVQAVSPQPEGGEEGGVKVAQPPKAVLKVESLPVDDEDQSSTGGEDDTPASGFSLNKQAGLINVFATQKQHKEIAAYLRMLERSVTAQVLVEAKIFEVALNDEYRTGIDWQAIAHEGVVNFLSTPGVTSLRSINNPGPLVGGQDFTTDPGGTFATISNFSLGYVGNDFQALLDAVSGFGTVRALASPRLTVLNNQSAVLNVATNQVYFEIDIDSTTDTGVTTVSVDSNVRSVPEGVLVNVQPSINLENNTVSMAVRPTVTRIVGRVSDPAVAFVAASIPGAESVVSEIPELNVQEIDTVVKVRSGQPIVMGGLLQDRSVNNEEGVPVLGEVPVVGSLFRRKNDLVRKSELVIFLKATILHQPEDSIDDTDRDLYKMFSGDRRPLKL